MKGESIVLIGMAGVGKSSVGILLSKTLGFDFVDLDDYILKMDGKTVQEIIDDEGEEALLRLEKRRMYEIDLASKVVAPGGSIIYHSDLMEYLRQHSNVVYLDDCFETIEKRLTNASTRGIVGLKNKLLRQIFDERRPLYSRYADITINCHGKSYEQIAGEILHHQL
jgi:shikimate kinase